MKGGILQGRALGPLLLYELTSITVGLLLQYPDDINKLSFVVVLLYTVAVQTIMCSQLSITQQWILQSKMKSVMWFRVSSNSTGFSYPDSHPPMSIDGVELTVTEKLKNLGLIFDCSLSWAHHVASVCSKISYNLYIASFSSPCYRLQSCGIHCHPL